MGRTELITASTTRLLTLEQAKLHCRCQHDAENDLFHGWIKAAEAFCQQHTQRALLTSTWRWIGPEFPTLDDEDAPIELGVSPIQSISSVTYFDTEGDEIELDAEDYQLEARIIAPRLYPGVDVSWPATQAGRIDAVTVEMVAGYTSLDLVPAQFTQAALLMIGEWYVNRETTQIPEAAIHLLNQVLSERYV